MAARAYWKGRIRLARVSIPVEIRRPTRFGAAIRAIKPAAKRVPARKSA